MQKNRLLVSIILASLCCVHAEDAKQAQFAFSDLEVPHAFARARSATTSIITSVEWQELQFDDLVNVIAEYAHTSLGSIGLKWLFVPINNRTEIENRQRIIRTLVENPDLLVQMEASLSAIKRGEGSLLKKMEMPSAIEGRSFHISKSIDQKLNRSTSVHDVTTFLSLVFFPALLVYVAYYKILGLSYNYSPWYNVLLKDQAEGFEKGKDAVLGLKQAIKLMISGTAGDKWMLARCTVFNNEDFYKFLLMKIWGHDALDKFIKKQEELQKQEQEKPEEPRKQAQPINFPPWFLKGSAWGAVYGEQMQSDLVVLFPLAFLYWTLKDLWDALTSEQARYVELAHATRSFKELGATIDLIAQKQEAR